MWIQLAYCLALASNLFPVSALDNSCEDLLKGKYLVSRLWTLAQPLGSVNTREGVVNSFDTGFAPDVQAMTGFVQYTGSAGDANYPSNNYFFNIFDQESEATAAQTAAINYKTGSELDDSIQEQTFGEGMIDFYTATACGFTNDFAGKYVASRMWTSSDAGTSSQDILDLFRTGFRSTVEEMSGFRLYLGVRIDDSKALFLNVFDDDAGSTAANSAAADFFASSDLAGKASVEKYSGMIGFDYTNFPNECTNNSNIVGKFLVGRLWSMADPAGDISTTAGVVEEFKDGFAPKVQAMEGFIQYLGSGGATESPSLCYFYNIFETEADAALAQQAAIAFKASGSNSLGNSIVENTFYEGQIDFFEAQVCGTEVDLSGKYVAARFWTSNSDTVSGQDIVDAFRDGFRQSIKKQPGFQLYMGVVTGPSTAAFVNVFDTQEGAADANTLAADFVSSNPELSSASLTAYSGPLDFDFRGQVPESTASSTTSSSSFLLLIAFLLLLL